MKLSILSKFEPVSCAVGYQTAWDSHAKNYCYINPKKEVSESRFTTRAKAEMWAEKVAKLVFHAKDRHRAVKVRAKILGNELNEIFENTDFREIDANFDMAKFYREEPRDEEEDLL